MFFFLNSHKTICTQGLQIWNLQDSPQTHSSGEPELLPRFKYLASNQGWNNSFEWSKSSIMNVLRKRNLKDTNLLESYFLDIHYLVAHCQIIFNQMFSLLPAFSICFLRLYQQYTFNGDLEFVTITFQLQKQ